MRPLNTEVLSEFGSTSCKVAWRCRAAVYRSTISSVIDARQPGPSLPTKRSNPSRTKRKNGLLVAMLPAHQ